MKNVAFSFCHFVLEYIKRHRNKLSEAQLNEIIKGMGQELDEQQIKAYFSYLQ